MTLINEPLAADHCYRHCHTLRSVSSELTPVIPDCSPLLLNAFTGLLTAAFKLAWNRSQRINTADTPANNKYPRQLC